MAIKQKLLTTSSLIIALCMLFLINIFCQYAFTNQRLDLTEHKLYTLSTGTKNIVSQIDEPITLRFFYSKKLSNGLASMNTYAAEVRELLAEYVRLSHGKIKLIETDPEAFSTDEDAAIGYGLQGVPVDESGSNFYFGLVGTNSTDIEKNIAFFQTERETYLEYDVTQMIYQLMHPQKPKVGIISSLPIQGMHANYYGQGNSAPWAIWEQMSQFYDLQMLQANLKEIPKDINVLMLISPQGLTDSALYAIDQFVLGGGRLLGFLDTYSEANPTSQVVSDEDVGKLNTLLKSWGVQLNAHQVVADKHNGKQVWFNHESRQLLVEYPFWFDLHKDQLRTDDIITGNLDNLTLATPGFFSFNKDKSQNLVIDTLLSTTQDAAEFRAEEIKSYQTAPEKIMQSYQGTHKSYPLAVRIQGIAKTAFPEGNPDKESLSALTGLTQSHDKINVILVSDADMLMDRFWLRAQNFLGQQVVLPVASNGSFLMNAIDNLSGSADLISVRSRGQYLRPFTTLRSLQQHAEEQFQSRQNELATALKDAEERLKKMNDHKVEGNKLILSQAQQAEIDNFRKQAVTIRQQLRDVQHELHKDIESLMTRIKVIDIGLMPLLIGLAGLGFWMHRKRIANT